MYCWRLSHNQETVSKKAVPVLVQRLLPKKPVRFPLLNSKGPKVKLSNRRLYQLIEFP